MDSVVEEGYGQDLLAAVDPTIYRRNGFRLTGLAVDSTAAQVRRRGEQMTALARLGGTPPVQPGTLLPLDPAPPVDAVQSALDELRSPDRRLIHELFWFWPAAADDPGTARLRAGDVEGAAAAWRDLGQQRSPAGAVALHNVAVLAHALALDAEATGGPAENYWFPALAFWQQVIDNDLCWEWLDGRVRELADPRLTADAATVLRTRLSRAVLSVNSTLAARALESDDEPRAGRQLQYINGSGLSPDEVRRANAAVATPVVEQIRRESRRALERISADKDSAREASDDLLTRTARPLTRLDAFYPAGNPTRDGARDEVALTLLQTAIAGQDQSMDDQAVHATLERAAQIAATDSARARLRENQDIIARNLKNQIFTECWWCKEPLDSADPAFDVKMYSDVRRTGNRVTWKSGSVLVPRCPTCRAEHAQVGKTATRWTTGFTLAIFVLVIFGIAAIGNSLWLGLASLVPLVLIGFMAVPRWQARIRISSTAYTFPLVAERLKLGWRIGVKPPT